MNNSNKKNLLEVYYNSFIRHSTREQNPDRLLGGYPHVFLLLADINWAHCIYAVCWTLYLPEGLI